MAVGSIVSGSDMPYAFRSRRQIEALPKTRSSFVIGIVNSDRLATVFFNNGKARNIGWPVSDIDHVRKWNRANIVGHVVVNVLRQVEQTFVDSKKILRFLRMADDPLRKSDPAFGVLGVLAAKHRP